MQFFFLKMCSQNFLFFPKNHDSEKVIQLENFQVIVAVSHISNILIFFDCIVECWCGERWYSGTVSDLSRNTLNLNIRWEVLTSFVCGYANLIFGCWFCWLKSRYQGSRFTCGSVVVYPVLRTAGLSSRIRWSQHHCALFVETR